MKILANDGLSQDGKDIILKAGFELVTDKIPQEKLVGKINDFDAIIVRSATQVTSDIIEAGTSLKVIARAGVGLDNVDTEFAKLKQIPVVNTPGASAISVAELAIAHIFTVCRFLNESNRTMPNGQWLKKDYSKGIEITGKTLGIIGFGAIGQEVARRALGLGMKVIYYGLIEKDTDLDVKFVDKNTLLTQSDIISLHIPFVKEKGATLGKEEFAKMKEGVIIINTARGGTVDETELLIALNAGKVARAGLDVFENEPPTEAQMEVINHPSVSVSPHIGGQSVEAQKRVGIEIAQKVVAFLNQSS